MIGGDVIKGSKGVLKFKVAQYTASFPDSNLINSELDTLKYWMTLDKKIIWRREETVLYINPVPFSKGELSEAYMSTTEQGFNFVIKISLCG